MRDAVCLQVDWLQKGCLSELRQVGVQPVLLLADREAIIGENAQIGPRYLVSARTDTFTAKVKAPLMFSGAQLDQNNPAATPETR
ncbi:hypothetical protein [Puerhibacterium sp. TATVAM-FAB25]|uniref:hypothetical protein n=1 Tax=Puerhibacterium sp. TATVAM-FAB25 TaxID=3093699 RepID=UPI003979640C